MSSYNKTALLAFSAGLLGLACMLLQPVQLLYLLVPVAAALAICRLDVAARIRKSRYDKR